MLFGEDVNLIGKTGIERNKCQKISVLGNYSLSLLLFFPPYLTKKAFPLFFKVIRGGV